MRASQHNQTFTTIPDTSAEYHRESRNAMRLTVTTNGAFFDLQGDMNENGAVNLHLATDGDSAELSIQRVDGDVALPVLRIFRERCA